MASRNGTDQYRSLTSSHSGRGKELVRIHGLLTFFFFLCFLPAECSQNGLKPGGAAKTRTGSFSCRCSWSSDEFVVRGDPGTVIHRVPLRNADQRHCEMPFTASIVIAATAAISFIAINADMQLRRMIVHHAPPQGVVLFLQGFPDACHHE
jgi:hypothetical protein